MVFLLLDLSLPFGLLNRLFHARRWFPTNLTRVFAEKLASPGNAEAVLVVSAADPRFWVMGGLLLAAAFLAAVRGRSFPRAFLFLAFQGMLFFSAEFLLPWMHGKSEFSSILRDFLFPTVARGHGRAYGWLHLFSVGSFLLFLRSLRRRAGLMDRPLPLV